MSLRSNFGVVHLDYTTVAFLYGVSGSTSIEHLLDRHRISSGLANQELDDSLCFVLRQGGVCFVETFSHNCLNQWLPKKVSYE